MSAYRKAVARAIHATWCPLMPPGPCDVDWAAADAAIAVPTPAEQELYRLRDIDLPSAVARLRAMARRSVELRRRLRRYEDGAVDGYASAQGMRDRITALTATVVRLVRERDEARAEVTQLTVYAGELAQQVRASDGVSRQGAEFESAPLGSPSVRTPTSKHCQTITGRAADG